MVATRSRPSLDGTLLSGRYRVERLVGRGGFADVYLARHAEVASLRVAIKVLHPAHRQRAAILKRFKREAALLGLLRNRHTVRLVDFGSMDDETPYLVMEYVEGAPLDRVIRRHARLRDVDAARVAIGCLKALVEAHALGVVHRDLKPANIFLVDEPGEVHPVARVLDFGVAKVMGDADVDLRGAARMLAGSRTRTDSVFCTPLYAAPELLTGSPDGRTDLYALGLVMAEMLDGVAPYADHDCSFPGSPHLSAEPVPLGPISSASPLAGIIRKACQKSARDRYATAAAMLADTQAVLDTFVRLRGPGEPLQLGVEADDPPRATPSTDAGFDPISNVDTGDLVRSTALTHVRVSPQVLRAPDLRYSAPQLVTPVGPVPRPASAAGARHEPALIAALGAIAAMTAVAIALIVTSSDHDRTSSRPSLVLATRHATPEMTPPPVPAPAPAPVVSWEALGAARGAIEAALVEASSRTVVFDAPGPGVIYLDGAEWTRLERGPTGRWTTSNQAAFPSHRPVEVRIIGRLGAFSTAVTEPGPSRVEVVFSGDRRRHQPSSAPSDAAEGAPADARPTPQRRSSLGPPVAPRTR